MPLSDIEKALDLQIGGPRPEEDQVMISDWAVETFGDTGTNLSVAIRANEEMAELLAALSRDDNDVKAVIEAADVVITFARLFVRFGLSLQDVIDCKMELNRKREWDLDGHGHGYHK
jgi:phosphoribosyl-ATP pyrophosphohydrolase